ncbi:hypothetical protein BC830DRAFT_1121967 [Chytriomyces sp. MP71]|nr:hypothetical protein BC830DRAFT_1121967 [Chytriomyces sp. MP71]
MSIFSAITLLILTAEIGAYLGSLVSPSLLPASQRRAMVKSLRDASENKQAQSAFVVGAAIVALLFVESAVALASIARENEENGGLKAEALQLWRRSSCYPLAKLTAV